MKKILLIFMVLLFLPLLSCETVEERFETWYLKDIYHSGKESYLITDLNDDLKINEINFDNGKYDDLKIEIIENEPLINVKYNNNILEGYDVTYIIEIYINLYKKDENIRFKLTEYILNVSDNLGNIEDIIIETDKKYNEFKSKLKDVFDELVESEEITLVNINNESNDDNNLILMTCIVSVLLILIFTLVYDVKNKREENNLD